MPAGVKRRKGRTMKKTLKIAVLLCLTALTILLMASCNEQIPEELQSFIPEGMLPEGMLPPTPSTGLAYTDNGDGTCTITGIGTCTDVDVVIPTEIDGLKVTKIGSYAFGENKKIQSLTSPYGVKEVCDRILIGCKTVTSVVIADSVTSIGEQPLNNSSRFSCKGAALPLRQPLCLYI